MATSPPIPPSINADVTSGNVPLVVQFTGYEAATFDIDYIKWDFGDSSYAYASWEPVHVYNVPGVYDVNLYVRNHLSFASTTESSYITVTGGGSLPVADFTVSDTTPVCMDPVVFTDTSTNYPTTWLWNFGDTGTSTQQNPVYTYNQPGTYTVALAAANWNGSDTETKTNYITVTMAEEPPTPAFSADITSYATLPVTVTFTDESTNGPTSWQWTFGDGYVSTLQNPTHQYTVSGSYTVTLIATNTYGDGTLTKEYYITVGDYTSTTTKIKVKRGSAANWAATPHYLDGGELGYDKTNKKLRIGPSDTASTLFASCDLVGGTDYTEGYGINITGTEISVDTTEVATQGDIQIYTAGTGLDLVANEFSADATEVAVLPAVWVESRYLKSTAVEGTLEWATAGGGSGAEYAGGYGINVDNVGYIITADTNEVASIPTTWTADRYMKSTATEGLFEWATVTSAFEPQITKILYVDKNRTDSYTPTGSIDKPFLTIGAATAIASDGTAILVYSGTYSENVVLPVGVSLEGFEENGIVIDGTLSTTNGGTGIILKGLSISGDVTIDTYCSMYDVYITGKVSLTDTLKLYAWHLYLITSESAVPAFTVSGNATVYLDFSFISSTGDAPAISQAAGTINVTNSTIQAIRGSGPVVDVNDTGTFRAFDTTITNASTGSSIDVSDASASSTYPHVLSNIIATGNIVCYVSYVIVNSLNFITGSISGSYIIYDPASRLDNDSFVYGDTVKDALETLSNAFATYTGGTGIDITGTVISVDETEAAVLPETWVASRYLKSTAVEGTLEWATAGTGSGIEDVPNDGNNYVRTYGDWVLLGTLEYSTNFTAKGQIVVGTGNATVSTLDPATNDYVLTLDSSTATGLKWAETQPGVTSFTALSDTPANYTGSGLKFVRVNSGETALEFTDTIDGGDSI